MVRADYPLKEERYASILGAEPALALTFREEVTAASRIPSNISSKSAYTLDTVDLSVKTAA